MKQPLKYHQIASRLINKALEGIYNSKVRLSGCRALKRGGYHGAEALLSEITQPPLFSLLWNFLGEGSGLHRSCPTKPQSSFTLQFLELLCKWFSKSTTMMMHSLALMWNCRRYCFFKGGDHIPRTFRNVASLMGLILVLLFVSLWPL